MSSMENLIGQAWDEYTKQRQGPSSSLVGTLEDLWHKIAQMEAPTPEDEEARLEICADLTERLASLGFQLGGFLAAGFHGSFLMGCFNNSSALEVAVTGKLPGSAGPNTLVDVELRSSAERLALLERAHSLIAASGIAAQGTVNINRTARVPSVSFEHAGSGIPVRVCIAYPNFALRPQVVRGLVQLEPRLRGLIQLVELWAEAHGLNNPAAGTFNSWALVNLVIFSAQTFQPQPLLPPLWRVCGALDPSAAAGTGPGGANSTTSSGGSIAASTGSFSGSGGILALGNLGGGSTSTAGAMPQTVRPTQRLPGLTASSEGLPSVLREIQSRLTGPPEVLGWPAGGHADPPAPGGLLSLFHWFLVVLDRLLAHWQLSWNRRWRVSTWSGQLVQQPFNRAFLVPVECPFDPADNAAKSLGCENQLKHQQVLRRVVEEVSASLRLLEGTKTPEDLDRLILGMFGLEVEHLYLEEEEECPREVVGIEEGAEEREVQGKQEPMVPPGPLSSRNLDDEPSRRQEDGAAASGRGRLDTSPSFYGDAGDKPGTKKASLPATSNDAPPASTGSAISSPGLLVRLLQGEQQHAVSPASRASPRATETRSGGNGKGGNSNGKAIAANRGAMLPGADSAGAAARTLVSTNDPSSGDLLMDVKVARVEVDDVDDTVVTTAGGSGMCGQQSAAAGESPALPTSSAAAITAASPVVIRGNARVQQPLSPLLRDVTNSRQYGHRNSQSGPEPKGGISVNPSAPSTSTATPSTESPPEESLLPFEGLFGSLLQGARRLFDNMAQGMAELSEDLNELAATTAATIRAVINDDEDLPFLGSSSAGLRRQRRQRLQLLHRGVHGGAANSGGAGSSPASSTGTSQPPSQGKQRPLELSALGSSAGRPGLTRASPLQSEDRCGAGSATPGRRAGPVSTASPGRRSPHVPRTVTPSATASPAGGNLVRSAAKRRSEGLTASLMAAATVATSAVAPSPPRLHPKSVSEAATGGDSHPGKLELARELNGSDAPKSGDLGPYGCSVAARSAAKAGSLSLQATDPASLLGGSLEVPNTAASTEHQAMLLGTPVGRCGRRPLAPSSRPAAPIPISGGPTPEQVSTDKAADQLLAAAAAAPNLELSTDGMANAEPQAISSEGLGGICAVGAADEPSDALLLRGVADARLPLAKTQDAALEKPDEESTAQQATTAVVPLTLGFLHLDSHDSGCLADGGPTSTCGASLTLASSPTADASLSTASSPTIASRRSFAPTPPRKSGPGHSQPLARADLVPATSSGVKAGATHNAPPPPPLLPPSPRPPVGIGGLRVKSAAFRKGTARDTFASPSATGRGFPGAPITSANTNTTATASPGPGPGPGGSGSGSSSAPFFLSASATITANTALDSSLGLTTARTFLQLSSSRLQELAECIDRAGPGTTIDLQGNTFTGPLAAPVMKVTAPGLWLVNGELVLNPEQQLVVVAKAARLDDIIIRDAAPAVAAAPAGPIPAPAASAGGAIRPALLVTKQSYVGGGELTLTRCRLLLGASRSVGLQVKGKGCSAVLEDCVVGGSSVAAAQASDGVMSLSRCTLEAGGGHGVCCRDNASVTVTDCRVRRFRGACAAVMVGGSLELVSCRFNGPYISNQDKEAGDDTLGAADGAGDVAAVTQPEEVTSSDTDSDGGGRDEGGGDTATTSACGPGVLAEGKGSLVMARGSLFEGFRSQAALVVTAGASASLEDCRATGCQQGAVVGTRGGRLLAARCELSSHEAHGLAIGEGATADLRDCRLQGNGASGLHVGGVGSMAVLRGCELLANTGSGVEVAAGGCANLDSCTARANGSAVGVRSGGCGGFDRGGQQGYMGRYGDGLYVEGTGARVTALRCTFSGNMGAGVRVGADGSVQLQDCGIYRNNDSSRAAYGRCSSQTGSGEGSSGGCDAVQPGRAGSIQAGTMNSEGSTDADPRDTDGLGTQFAEESGRGEMRVGVEVEVEAYGRLSLSKGCIWRSPSGDGAAGGEGPEHAVLVAELGCLERSEDN
ncbi:hypothetical protein VaNZ11_003598 [Volvox africanus]|uniref:Right handed beta helix domain-containing protein n=1 Tax=Volvox africanus TaxID=51714 RepID=A0ABQ5RUH7_9CHLO|nr:hypothetical protein VaNZ11_003598 [Volvox africanus]